VEVTSKLARTRMRILIHDRLKLLVRFGGTLLNRREGREIGLRRHSGGTHLRAHGAYGFAELDTSLLVLLLEVVPAAESSNRENEHAGSCGDHFVLVFNAPMYSGFGGVDGGPAEAVLFKRMSSFCAHVLPF